MSTPALRLDWCSHEAAKYAVEHWHYSRLMPAGFPQVRVGVWEYGRYIGAVVFGRGASDSLLTPYGLTFTEGAELLRVALCSHAAPVSRIVAIALRLLRTRCPGLRLVVSFADPLHDHVGGIYQAGGWVYTGTTSPDAYYIDANGRRWHSRNVSSTGIKSIYGTQRRVPTPKDCVKVETPGKHRYLMPFDAEMRQRVAPLARPYPKKPTTGRASGESDTPAIQAGEGAAMRPHGSVSLATLG